MVITNIYKNYSKIVYINYCITIDYKYDGSVMGDCNTKDECLGKNRFR